MVGYSTPLCSVKIFIATQIHAKITLYSEGWRNWAIFEVQHLRCIFALGRVEQSSEHCQKFNEIRAEIQNQCYYR